jgi:hypothetical protein
MARKSRCYALACLSSDFRKGIRKAATRVFMPDIETVDRHSREWEIAMSVTQVKITLVGGPADLAVLDRSVPVADPGRVLKIRHGSGYEHFVHEGECETVDGHDIAVFRWTARTKIAE